MDDEELNNEEIEVEEEQQENTEMPSTIDKAVDTAAKIKQAKNIALFLKTYWPIIAPVAVVLFKVILIILLVLIVILIFFMGITFVTNNINESMDMMNRFENFIYGKGFNTSTESFSKELNRQKELYEDRRYTDGDFDTALILSTIHYNREFNQDAFLDDQELGTDEFNFDVGATLIDKTNVNYFYDTMYAQLGNVLTIMPANRRLVGHYVDLKFEHKCGMTDFGDLESLGPIAVETILPVLNSVRSSLLQALGGVITIPISSFRRLAQDEALKNINSENLSEEEQTSLERAISQIEGEIKVIQTYLAESSIIDVAGDIDRIMDNSFKEEVICKETRVIDEETGETEEYVVPPKGIKPVFYINEDLYKEYLIKYYVPRNFIDCRTCQYPHLKKLKLNDPARVNLARIITEEIFDARDAYNESRTVELTNAERYKYITGGTSLPFVTQYRGKDIEKLVSSYFGIRKDPFGLPTKEFHDGIDIAGRRVTDKSILAMAPGKIILIRKQNGGYGNQVLIEHQKETGEKVCTRYAHLETIDASLAVGTEVDGGQMIGIMGSTGRSTGIHLHFEVIKDCTTTIDPLPTLISISEGINEFAGGQKYFSSQDEIEGICQDTTDNRKYLNALAMSLDQIGIEKTPKDLSDYLCENYSSTVDYFSLITNNSDVQEELGIKITPISEINRVDEALAVEKAIIIKGTVREYLSTETYLVITDNNAGEYRLLNQDNKNHNSEIFDDQFIERLLESNTAYIVEEFNE